MCLACNSATHGSAAPLCRLNSIISLSANQQACAAGALVAVLQRDGVLTMSAVPVTNSDMSLDGRQETALHVESLAEARACLLRLLASSMHGCIIS